MANFKEVECRRRIVKIAPASLEDVKMIRIKDRSQERGDQVMHGSEFVSTNY